MARPRPRHPATGPRVAHALPGVVARPLDH
jgi:hypothetical protein